MAGLDPSAPFGPQLLEPQVGRDASRMAMRKVKTEARKPDMRAEYDFTGGVRGKYAARFAKGTNIVILEPDVAERFPDSKSVNDALRALVAVADRKAPRRAGRRTAKKSVRGSTHRVNLLVRPVAAGSRHASQR